MSLDARLSSIVDEASEGLRTSLRDALAGMLVSIPLPINSLREVAKRAYELGYREALASQGHTPGDLLGAAAREAPQPSGVEQAALPSGPHASGPDTEDFEDLDWEDEPEVLEEAKETTAEATGGKGHTASDAAPMVDWSRMDAVPERVVEDESGGTARARSPMLRIYPHATVATLRQRIVDVFDLTRFQIDVIVCRKGDRARRQLKGTVKLSKYLVEE